MAEDSKEKQKQKAKKASTSKTIDTWKHKKWYTIIAPEAFHHTELGETPANEPTEVENREAIVNLMVLTGNAKRQNTNVTFKINKVQGDKAYTELVSYQLVPSAIKRMVRRNKTRVDDSFVCKTKDGRLIRIKPFLLTASLARNAATTAIRRAGKQQVVRMVAKLTFDALCQDLVSSKFQKEVKDFVNPIYPLVSSEVRMMEIITGEYTGKIEEPTPEPKKKAKEEEYEEPQPEADKAAVEAGESDAEEATHDAEEAIEEEAHEEQSEESDVVVE